MSQGSLGHRKVVCKNQRPKSKDKKVTYHLLSLRQTPDIVAYKGAMCNQKESHRAHQIIERLHTKNYGPKGRDKKVSNQLLNLPKKDGRTQWLIKMLYSIKSDVLLFIGPDAKAGLRRQRHSYILSDYSFRDKVHTVWRIIVNK